MTSDEDGLPIIFVYDYDEKEITIIDMDEVIQILNDHFEDKAFSLSREDIEDQKGMNQ